MSKSLSSLPFVAVFLLIILGIEGCQTGGSGSSKIQENIKGLETPLPAPGFQVDGNRMDPDRPGRPHGSSYSGPIVDTHAHMIFHDGHPASDTVYMILQSAENNGVERQIFLPTPNDQRMPYYNLHSELRQSILNTGGERAGLLCGSEYLTVWMAHAFQDGYSLNSLNMRMDKLSKDIDCNQCLGIGEIGPYHFEKKPGQAVLRFPVNFRPFLEMAHIISEKGVWLDLHAEPKTASGKSYEKEVFGGIELLYDLYPDLKLILAHTGMTNSNNARSLLETYPNIMMHLKLVRSGKKLNWKNLGPIANKNRELYEDWAKLMEDMPDRFMVGTDFRWGQHTPETYKKRIKRVRRVLGSINPQAAELIAYKNARSVYGQGRSCATE